LVNSVDMLWVYLSWCVMWLAKLPLYLLPPATYLPMPVAMVDAIATVGRYFKWIIYIPGTTVGDAIVQSIQFMIPLAVAVFCWRLFRNIISSFVFGMVFNRATPKQKKA